MKAFIIRADRVISPFNEHLRSLLILNRPLKDHQEGTLRDLNIDFKLIDKPSEVDEEGEKVVFYDYTYFSKNLLEEFLRESRRRGKATICSLKKGAFTSRTVTSTMNVEEEGGYIAYKLFYYPDGLKEGDPDRLLLNPDEYVEEMRFPSHMVKGGKYRVPITTKRLLQIEHWANLWVCNISGVLSFIQELRKSSKLKLLRMALKARSTNPWRVSAQNVQVGEGCDIHPTAYLENTRVGDGVEVGAGTVIRGSVIDDDTVIANNVNLSYSVIGKGCNVRDGACIQYSVLYPGAFVACSFLNCGFMGRDTFIGDGATLTDCRYDEENVRVMHNGRVVDTGSMFLGSCVGH